MLSGVSEEPIRTAIDNYMNDHKNILNGRNMDRVYDELSVDDIGIIFKSIQKQRDALSGKSGLEDCLDDKNLRIFPEQEATKVVKETVLEKEQSKEQSIEEKNQQR